MAEEGSTRLVLLLPGILIGDEFPGDCEAFEEAVEFNELEQFLRLKEEWKPFEDDKPALPAQPVGVAGAYTPAQMHPHHQPTPSPQPSPLKSKAKATASKAKGFDAGEELGDSRLQGVNVTDDDLLALVEELGLGGDDASDLVKGLTGDSHTPAADQEAATTKVDAKPKPDEVKGGETKLDEGKEKLQLEEKEDKDEIRERKSEESAQPKLEETSEST
ncbi:predicted protein [Postia placenta Mad-698-R]|nr:predicted protein [Postia placenta Mad-698-R]